MTDVDWLLRYLDLEVKQSRRNVEDAQRRLKRAQTVLKNRERERAELVVHGTIPKRKSVRDAIDRANGTKAKIPVVSLVTEVRVATAVSEARNRVRRGKRVEN